LIHLHAFSPGADDGKLVAYQHTVGSTDRIGHIFQPQLTCAIVLNYLLHEYPLRFNFVGPDSVPVERGFYLSVRTLERRQRMNLYGICRSKKPGGGYSSFAAFIDNLLLFILPESLAV
jgi:hypothetical protein